MKQWREIALMCHLPLEEAEAVPIFISTLKGAYYSHLLSHVSYSFSDLVHAGEMVERGLCLGKIQNSMKSVQAEKKRAFSSKKSVSTSF